MVKEKFSGLETLKEMVRVRIEDKDGVLFKKYDVKDIKVIKDVDKEDDNLNVDNPEDLKELEKMEKLEAESQEDI